MKHVQNLLLLVIGLALVAPGCSSGGGTIDPPRQTIHGSGVVVQEDRAVSGFTGVNLQGIGSLHIEQGGVEALRIEAEDNLISHLNTSVRSGTLHIWTDDTVNLQPTLPIKYHLTVTTLDTIVLAGVNGVDLVNFDGQQLDVTLSGFSQLRTSGRVVDQVVRLSGVTSYDGRDLASTNATVTNSSVANATVRVSDRLDVTINGVGSVFYIGSPTVTRRGSGVGRVVQIPG